MKGIILHGGHGTRLRPLTHTGPKQLLPIANKPMSQYCIESICDAGITDIAIIIGGLGANKVRDYYGNGENFGVNITYIEQDEPRGIAHAIRLCKEFVNNEKFLVFLGDNIIQKPITNFVENFNKSDYDATVLLCEVDNPSRFGIADVENEKIIKITEKPKKPTSNLAVTGIYLLTPLIFEVIDNLKPSWRNELEITDALDNLLKQNDNIGYETITDYWKDTGTPDDILNANRQVLEHICSKAENILVDESSQDQNFFLDLPCIVGKNCKIDESAQIGPNASIGDNTIISSDVVIENSIIMSDCKIDGGLNIKDSIISANCHLHGNNKDKTKKIFLLGEGTKITL
ncbi:glucose-1-phosphate thymidylyltransferase [Marine Group I thaumarchaeote]|uniref:Glucose-1-phosphate thymidylyltransferase n=1 Tax=Marine Group I thaumarchaeote TaxID=2511932 RepID=A0A7K4NTK7_9ARCH|nr:glucose-1-phosphate thymidylyltransferase [Marine Group I thaumarchaeote]